MEEKREEVEEKVEEGQEEEEDVAIIISSDLSFDKNLKNKINQFNSLSWLHLR